MTKIKSEWQTGFETGQYDILCSIASLFVEDIYTPYTTVERRKIALQNLRRLEDFLPNEDE